MSSKYIIGIIFICLGIFFQFGFGFNGVGAFWGSILVLLSPLFIPPHKSDLDFYYPNDVHKDNGETKTVTLSKSLSEIKEDVQICSNYNTEQIAQKNESILNLITIMKVAGVILAIFMFFVNINSNYHFGSIIVDAIFVPYFIFKCLYDWPVLYKTIYESTYFEDEHTIRVIDNTNPDNPYFGYIYKAVLERNSGHALVKSFTAEFKLKKKIPNLLCAQVQIAHNNVMGMMYPYAYFVMVYPEKFTDFALNLQEITQDFLKQNKYSFIVETKNDDSNIILIVRISERACPPYHTNSEKCKELSNIMLFMLNVADTEDSSPLNPVI